MPEYYLNYGGCRIALLRRLHEPPPGRIQILTGPRQVGKTTLLLDLTDQIGQGGYYVAADDPQAGLPGFWDRIWTESEKRAGKGGGVLFIDEIQHIAD
jgi:predicted AAA+ superfamily ATPase